MYLGLNNLGLNSISKAFSPQSLFFNSEPGFHAETYDPNTLLRRRNRLTYSEQFDNAAWSRTNILSVTANADGVGDFVVPSTTNGLHLLAQSVSSIGVANTIKVRAKAGGYDWIALQIGSSSAYLNLSNGSLGTVSANGTATVAAVGEAPGYYDLTFTAVASSANCFIFAAQANVVAAFAGDGTSGIYLARAQLEWNTTTPSEYQLVTDWNTEYLAAALESVGMWQDSGGRDPVTAVEQPVGRWMDSKLSRTWVRGSNTVSNGGFDSAAGWTAGAGIVIGSGVATFTASTAVLSTTTTMVSGRNYELTFDVSGYTGGSLQIRFGGSSVGFPGLTTSTTKLRISGVSGGALLEIVGNTPLTFVIDNVEVREVSGNHATQANSGSRPILSARYNLLTKTEQFDDAAWTKSNCSVTANTGDTTDPLGGNTADLLTATGGAAIKYVSQTATLATASVLSFYLKTGTHRFVQLINNGDAQMYANFDLVGGSVTASGTAASATMSAAGNGWYLCTVRFTPGTPSTNWRVYFIDTSTAGYAAGSASAGTIYAWGADLRTSNDAALNIPAYQRVNTSTDYDTDGFIHYLKFDGTDDSFATPSIDFSGVDKVAVWTGATKLSDAAAAVLCELSATSSANNGTFGLFAPNTAAAAFYLFRHRGTVFLADAATGGFAAPTTDVCTGIGSIADDTNKLRVDGALWANQTADQGAGNLSNNPLYIGRRNNTSLPLNGRLTSLTVRGTSTPSTTPDIVSMEQYSARLAGQQFAST